MYAKLSSDNRFEEKFAVVNPGEFMMGSPIGESGRSENEFLHKVRITRPFFISRFETTIHEWKI